MNLLDVVAIQPKIGAQWKEETKKICNILLDKYPDLQIDEIPEEQFRVLPDGTGEIFVKVRNAEIKMKVSPLNFMFLN